MAATVALLSILLIAIARPTCPQEHTGVIGGRVTDSTGTAIGGASVEAREPDAAVHSTVTRPDGTYRFPALPPASYVIIAHAARHGSVEVAHVAVMPGQRIVLDLALGGDNARAPAPAYSARPSHTNSAMLARTTIQRLPVPGHDVAAALSLIPSASQASAHSVGPQIDGAPPWMHRYVVDGVDSTDPATGSLAPRMHVDFVEAISITRSAYSVGLPGTSGAVVSIIGRAGSNRVHGTGASSFEAEWLLGSPRARWRINPFDNDTAEFVTPPRDQWRRNNPVFDIGGPIARGRAWFYGGYTYDRNAYRRAAIFRNSPPPFERRVFTWHDEEQGVNWNVTLQPRRSLRMKVSGAATESRTRGSAPPLQPEGSRFADGSSASGFTTAAWDSEPAAFRQRWQDSGIDRPSHLYALRADWVLSPAAVLNITSGYQARDARTPAAFYGNRTVHHFARSNLAMAGIPGPLRFGRGYTDNRSTTATARERLGRLSVAADSTWFARWAGEHVFRAGVRAERLTDQQNRGDQAPGVELMWNQAYVARDGRLVRGAYGYYEVGQPRVIGESRSHNAALWAEDSWTIGDRLTIDGGLRMENEHVGSYSADPGLDFGFRDKIAPRLGFTYALGEGRGSSASMRGRTSISGTYSWLYDAVNSSMATRLLGAVHDERFVYTLDTYDWPAIDCAPADSGCPGVFVERVHPTLAANAFDPRLLAYFGVPSNTIDPALRPSRTVSTTLSFDHAAGSTATFSARYVRKRLSRTLQQVRVMLPGVGEVGFLGNPGFGLTRVMLPDYPRFALPPAARDYDALELGVTRRARNWSLTAEYVLSSLRGNYSSSGSGYASDRRCAGCAGWFASPYSSWDSNGRLVAGPLPTDRPHHLEVQASYDFSSGTSIAAIFEAFSGTPLDSQLSWKGATVYFNGRGDLGRTPAVCQLDLLLRQDVRVSGAHRVTLSVNITNVFDQATPTLFTTNRWRDTFNFGDDVFFGGWDAPVLVQQIRASGGTMRDNPMFLKPRSNQPPRAIRLAVKYEF